MAETQNLMDGLLQELNRAREIKKLYDEIPEGRFGSVMIQREISRTEAAIVSGDVVEMLSCYATLQEIQ